jgi:hypothetical protein
MSKSDNSCQNSEGIISNGNDVIFHGSSGLHRLAEIAPNERLNADSLESGTADGLPLLKTNQVNLDIQENNKPQMVEYELEEMRTTSSIPYHEDKRLSQPVYMSQPTVSGWNKPQFETLQRDTTMVNPVGVSTPRDERRITSSCPVEYPSKRPHTATSIGSPRREMLHPDMTNAVTSYQDVKLVHHHPVRKRTTSTRRCGDGTELTHHCNPSGGDAVSQRDTSEMSQSMPIPDVSKTEMCKTISVEPNETSLLDAPTPEICRPILNPVIVPSNGDKMKTSKPVNVTTTAQLNPDAPAFEPSSNPLFVRQVKFSDNSLFVTGGIESVSTSILLDTGAALTCVSGSLWRQCAASMTSEVVLKEADGSLQSATGEDLKILGVADLTFQIGSLEFEHSAVIVENLAHTCLLGSDFFTKHQCTIRYDTVTLIIGETEIPLRKQQEEPKICRVVLGKGIRIPANTEMILPGKLAKSGKVSHLAPGMVEAKYNQTKFTTGRTLVRSDYGKVPVRVANFSDKPLHIHNNQTLGWFYPVAEIDATDLKNKDDHGQNDVNKGYKAPEMTKRSKKDKKPNHVRNDSTPNLGNLKTSDVKVRGKPIVIGAVQNNDINYTKPDENQEKDSLRLKSLLEKLEIDDLGLEPRQKEIVCDMIEKYQFAFSMGDFDLGHTTILQHTIETGDAVPIKQRPRRVPPHQQKFVDETTKELLDRGLIQESQSPWSSPIVLAKKADGSYRLCIDYRKLNSCTVKSAQPLARIDDTLNQLSGSRYFTGLDCASGYWQVGVAPGDSHKTSFVTGVKQYEWNSMPFGLTGAPSTFTRMMNIVLGGLEHCLVYLDDIIVHSSTFDEHVEQLAGVFERLQKANLKLKPSKCKLFQSMLKFLGHIVSEEGISTDPAKVQKVADWPTPTCVAEVRSFMGLATYYQKYVKDFANMAAPLYNLTKKNTTYRWTEDCEAAFLKLKESLISSPVLVYPNFSEDAGMFVLDTDASDFGLGGVLSQKQDDESERVIAYGSKSLHGGELNYCTTRREMLALVTFAEHFRYFLLGKKFLVRTDNMALRWLLNFKEPSGQIARWIERLAEFDFIIEHRPGVKHGNADALSRRPKKMRQHGDCPSCGPTDLKGVMQVKAEVTSSEQLGAYSLKPKLNRVCSKEKTNEAMLRWSEKGIESAQRDDPDLKNIYNHLAEDKGEPSKAVLQGCSVMERAVWAQRERIEMCDGILYLKPEKESSYKKRRLILPKTMVKPVFLEAHEGFAGGHLGIRKTEGKIRERCWRPMMKRQIRELVRSCKVCQLCKSPPHGTKAPLQSMPVGRRNQRIHVDVIGPINPPSRRGNKYILVLQDAFTKWPEAWPLKNQKATTCAKIIVNEYVTRFGAPENIHTDQGTNFESTVFKEMCQLLNISKTRTTAYHPQCNGQVENLNKTLKSMLTTMVEEEGRDWDDCLPSALMAFRSSIQVSTEETPFALMFGEEMSVPLDLVIGTTDQSEVPTTTYIANLRERLESSYQRARDKIKLAQRRQRTYYDQKHKNASFSVGDLVLLKNHYIRPDVPPKFHRRWMGPFRVLERISEVNYKIVATEGRNVKPKVVHLNNMKKFISRDVDENVVDTSLANLEMTAKSQDQPPNNEDSDSDSDSEYEYTCRTTPMTLKSDKPLEIRMDMNADNEIYFDLEINEPQPGPSESHVMAEADPNERHSADSLESGTVYGLPMQKPDHEPIDSMKGPEAVIESQSSTSHNLRSRDQLRRPIRYRESIGSVAWSRY